MHVVERTLPREPLAERVQRLQTQAREGAKDHIAELLRAMVALHEAAEEISHGGDVYPAGVRSEARNVAADLAARSLSINAIMARVR